MSRSVVAVALVLAAFGCGSSFGEAKAAFKQGRYAEAKDLLAEDEASQTSWTPKKATEYALYRGLAHAALGDRAEATKWLHRAKAAEDHAPGTLSLDDRTRLELALESMSPDVAPAPP